MKLVTNYRSNRSPCTMCNSYVMMGLVLFNLTAVVGSTASKALMRSHSSDLLDTGVGEASEEFHEVADATIKYPFVPAPRVNHTVTRWGGTLPTRLSPHNQSSTSSARKLSLRQAFEHTVEGFSEMTTKNSDASIEPNDFWALRDLLLISYAGVFMQQGSVGHQVVQAHALDFAGMLPLLHPYAPCRDTISQVLASAPSGSYASDPNNKERLIAVAAAAWSCLPAKFTTASFLTPFTTDMMGRLDLSYAAHMTIPVDPSLLGACRESHWPRTCSYWATMHAMSKRADALGVGDRFFDAFASMAAAGATMCAGCTFHWHALHKDFLDPRILQDFGSSF